MNNQQLNDLGLTKYVYDGFVLEVYDGDTMTIDLDLGLTIRVKLQVRLARLNTPEVRGKEKGKGVEVRDLVRSMVLHQPVTVQTIKDSTEKFGRYLAEIFLQDGTNLNDFLLDNDHAKLYKK